MKLEIVLLVLGALLMAGALVAGLVRRSFLSLAALFVLAGFALGQGGLEVLEFDARSGFVHDLAVVALIVILFRDGLEVEAEMLQTGVGTVTFSLFVLGEGIPDGERIFNLAALCVFTSVLVHGLSDTPGSEWLIRREARPAPGRPGTPTPPAGDAPA